MAKISKHFVPAADVMAELNINASAITTFKKKGLIADTDVVKDGRSTLIHKANLFKALKNVPAPQRGRIPGWASIVGNKAMMKVEAARKAAA